MIDDPSKLHWNGGSPVLPGSESDSEGETGAKLGSDKSGIADSVLPHSDSPDSFSLSKGTSPVPAKPSASAKRFTLSTKIIDDIQSCADVEDFFGDLKTQLHCEFQTEQALSWAHPTRGVRRVQILSQLVSRVEEVSRSFREEIRAVNAEGDITSDERWTTALIPRIREQLRELILTCNACLTTGHLKTDPLIDWS